MPSDRHPADRVRAALSGRPSVREVRMFGGLAFMVDDRMVVSAMRDGDLLVRADPARTNELLAIRGARPAEMGAGRAMGDGWITVAATAIAADEDLEHWIGVALEHHAAQAVETPSRRGPRGRTR